VLFASDPLNFVMLYPGVPEGTDSRNS